MFKDKLYCRSMLVRDMADFGKMRPYFSYNLLEFQLTNRDRFGSIQINEAKTEIIK